MVQTGKQPDGEDPAVESMTRRAYDMGAKSWGAPPGAFCIDELKAKGVV